MLIERGSWVDTLYGEAVVTGVSRDGWVSFRYGAVRCSDGAPLWVAARTLRPAVRYLGGPDLSDDQTAYILSLTGHYGEGALSDAAQALKAWDDRLDAALDRVLEQAGVPADAELTVTGWRTEYPEGSPVMTCETPIMWDSGPEPE